MSRGVPHRAIVGCKNSKGSKFQLKRTIMRNRRNNIQSVRIVQRLIVYYYGNI